jgi:hypothetical protein
VVGSQTFAREVEVEVQGNVTYLVAYEDPAGNIADNVTRSSRITAVDGWVTIDTIAPILPWVDLVSNNVKHPQLAREGDTIFLTINASEWIDIPKIYIAEREPDTLDLYGGRQLDTWHDIDVEQPSAHYLFNSGMAYNATITVVGTQTYQRETPIEVQGNVTIWIEFEDPAGNSAETVTRVTRETTDQGWVTIDTIAPILPWVDMISNNAKHPQLAKEGNTIFLTMNASEWIDVPKVIMAEREAEGVHRYGGYQFDPWHSIDIPQLHEHYLYKSCPVYNATITIVGTQTYGRELPVEVQGNMTFVIDFEDPAGNQGEDVTRVTRETTDQGWVTIDTIAPILPWVDIISNNVKHPQLAKEGDTIFLSMNASEWIDLPRVIIADRWAETVNRYGGYQVDTWHNIDIPQLHAHYLYGSCVAYNATITIVGTQE